MLKYHYLIERFDYKKYIINRFNINDLNKILDLIVESDPKFF